MTDRFRFLRDDLQRRLLRLVAAMELEHREVDGYLCTRERDQYIVEDLRSAVRSSVFDDWHLWRGGAAKAPALHEQYRAYMEAHQIPYVEEDDNGSRWFLLSRSSDPYSWGVEPFVRP